MKLFISRPMPQAVIEMARAEFDVTLRAETTPLSQAEMVAALQGFDIVLPTLGDRFGAEVFAAVPNPRARLLANFGVGYNHIDVAAARAAGITVTNTPGAVTDATADIALTLMLMAARRAGEGERLVRSGQWQGWYPTQMLGTHLTGKRLGILGMGRIGQAIAKRAHHGFDMPVAYFTRSPRDLPGYTPVDDLHTLLASSDFVVIAVPASPATHHLIDAAALAAMGPQAILVNIARGDIVDEGALVQALQSRTIAAAGLDVYEHEPRLAPGLMDLDNVVLFPHLGTAADEVRTQMGMMALGNAMAHRDGLELPNVV